MTDKKQEKDDSLFNLQNINQTIQDCSQEITKTKTNITAICAEMRDVIANKKKILSNFKSEMQPLYLLPQKTASAVENITPKLAKEIEILHAERVDNIVKKIEYLNHTLESNSKKLEQNLENIAITSIEKINTAYLKQIAEYQETLTKGAKEITDNNGGKFLRNLVITVIIATFAAGFTSWGIHYYFPKSVKVLKSGDIAIQNESII